jgi:hypothetical protein
VKPQRHTSYTATRNCTATKNCTDTKNLFGVGATEEVTHLRDDPNEVACICPLTVAVQGSGKLRLRYNARPVNSSMPVEKFKLEHIQVALGLVQPGDMLDA